MANQRTVKLPLPLVQYAEEEADLQSRSTAGQIAHWVRLGRALEQSRHFDFAQISKALAGSIPADSLTPVERPVFYELAPAALEQTKYDPTKMAENLVLKLTKKRSLTSIETEVIRRDATQIEDGVARIRKIRVEAIALGQIPEESVKAEIENFKSDRRNRLFDIFASLFEEILKERAARQ